MLPMALLDVKGERCGSRATDRQASGMRYQQRSRPIEASSADGRARYRSDPPVGLALRASRRAPRLTAVWLLIVLGACSPVASASPTAVRAALGLAASSSGVCEAIAALPDVSAAQRAFTNVAHDALHGLAADPRLDRPMSARVLEAMQKVEADFERQPGEAVLTADLTELRVSADAALQAIGEVVPACAG